MAFPTASLASTTATKLTSGAIIVCVKQKNQSQPFTSRAAESAFSSACVLFRGTKATCCEGSPWLTPAVLNAAKSKIAGNSGIVKLVPQATQNR
jgi:hypothetical protein